jgi:hypothetical protein
MLAVLSALVAIMASAKKMEHMLDMVLHCSFLHLPHPHKNEVQKHMYMPGLLSAYCFSATFSTSL